MLQGIENITNYLFEDSFQVNCSSTKEKKKHALTEKEKEKKNENRKIEIRWQRTER